MVCVCVAGDGFARGFGQWLAFGLAHVEQAALELEAGHLLLCAIVALDLEGAFEDVDRDGAFAPTNPPAEPVPSQHRRDPGRVWALHGDEHAVQGAVAMELRACLQPPLPSLGGAELANGLLDALGIRGSASGALLFSQWSSVAVLRPCGRTGDGRHGRLRSVGLHRTVRSSPVAGTRQGVPPTRPVRGGRQRRIARDVGDSATRTTGCCRFQGARRPSRAATSQLCQIAEVQPKTRDPSDLGGMRGDPRDG